VHCSQGNTRGCALQLSGVKLVTVADDGRLDHSQKLHGQRSHYHGDAMKAGKAVHWEKSKATSDAVSEGGQPVRRRTGR
jgi:hypothetical protein